MIKQAWKQQWAVNSTRKFTYLILNNELMIATKIKIKSDLLF